MISGAMRSGTAAHLRFSLSYTQRVTAVKILAPNSDPICEGSAVVTRASVEHLLCVHFRCVCNVPVLRGPRCPLQSRKSPRSSPDIDSCETAEGEENEQRALD